MTQTKQHAAFLYRLADALDTGAMPVDPEKLREIAQHLDEMTIAMIGLRRELETERALSLRNQVADLHSKGHRLALALECLLMDTKDTAVVSKWWDEAHEALEQWRN